MRKIFFTKNELDKTIDFADKIKGKHPHFTDKNNDAERTEEEVFNSVVRGKLAEIAMHKYLKKKHAGKKCILSELDFNIYKKGISDDFDLKFNEHTISIKSSKPYASCLLIETEKYFTDEDGNAIGIEGKVDNIPDFYAFVKVDVDYNLLENSYAVICGAISHREFWSKKRVIPRGTRINKSNMQKYLLERKPLSELDNPKGVQLLASNYGVHIDLLKAF